MKISKNQLRKIINEELEIHMSRNLDYHGASDGKMTRQQLYHIRNYADELFNMIQDNDDLPEWVQSKVSVMSNNIGKIKHYLEYKIAKQSHDL